MSDHTTRSEAVTTALLDFTSGDRASAATLIPLVYEELRELAARYMEREGGYRTLQATALVHEAFMRLVKVERIEWQSRSHFFAFAATQMRRILVEHARSRSRIKRGQDQTRVTLNEAMAITPERSIDILALEDVLRKLARRSPRQARVAELRLFSGMYVREIAEVLEVSEKTVKNDWAVAKVWLAAKLGGGNGGGP